MSNKNSVTTSLNLFFIGDLFYKLFISYLLFLFVPLVFKTVTLSYFAYVIIVVISSAIYDNLTSGHLVSFFTNIFNFIIIAIIYIFYKSFI